MVNHHLFIDSPAFTLAARPTGLLIPTKKQNDKTPKPKAPTLSLPGHQAG
jgi:hypothetical protein